MINNKNQITKTVKEILAKIAKLDPSNIGLQTKLIEDLKLDSLQILLAITEIGQNFDLNFEYSNQTLHPFNQVSTVNDVINLICEKKQLS